jgi:hypothetical protein
MVNYADLRNIEQKEKSTTALGAINPSFYSQTLQYLAELERRVKESEVEHASSKKTTLLIDELRNTRRLFETIIERREKKIVMAALSIARGSTQKTDNLTDEEKKLFDGVSHVLAEFRNDIYHCHAREVIIVRALKDVPQFVGSDMKTYALRKEDVLSLPADVACLLIKRHAAEEVTTGD